MNTSNKIRIRIGDIELRTSHTLDGKEYYDIVKYQPNCHYGKEDEYELDTDGEFYKPKDKDSSCRIHKDCFKYKETCFSIASFKGTSNEDDLVSVGARLWNSVSRNEWYDLYDILKYYSAKVNDGSEIDFD